MILIEEAVTDNPVACFTKDVTLQQVQFWKVGWTDYKCCRSLVGETPGGDSCQKEKIVTPEPDEELDDKCVVKGNIDIDPKYRSGTRWTLGELKLTIAGLEYLPEAKKFRVFVADSEYVYKELAKSGAPSVTNPDNIRLFFENGKDVYVFYILEDKTRLKENISISTDQGYTIAIIKRPNTPVLKPSDLKNSVSVKLSETTCRNKCIFGHSAYGFYYSPSPSSCVSLLNTTSTHNCPCAEDKYCVYDPAKDRNEPTQYSHARIRNSVMCNLIVERNTTIFIEEIADNPLSCFTKSKTLHQVQFWKDGWKEYNCCRSLVGDTSGSNSCQIDPKKNPTSKRTFPPKPDKRVSSTTTESDIEPVNPPNVEYFIVTPSSSHNLLNHVYHGALMVICVASCVMFRELWD
ncbi:hypothetical protein Ddc_19345 [Ditylenchus destructor]|nr:hypothetical protein Ddc_19345 [Ditylenchus destructor]